MSKVITDSSKIDFKEWDAFVDAHPNGHFFQSAAAYQFFLSVKNYEPVAICSLDSNENINGVLLCVIQKEHTGIAGKFSSRSICWGGPLVKDNDVAIVESLLKDYIAQHSITVSQLGRGLSTGSELEYADPETIKNALLNRH